MSAPKRWLTGDPRWDEIDPAELYARCLRFEEDAWELVSRRVNVIARRRRFGLSAERAQDLAQEVLIRLMDRVRAVREPAAFKKLVGRIAQNRILDAVRVPDRLLAILDDGPETPGGRLSRALDSPEWNPEAAVLAADRARSVIEALGRLGEPCRSTLWAWAGAESGRAYAELSAASGQRVGTISSRVTRCLRRLSQDPALACYALAGRSRQKPPTGARPGQRGRRR